MALVGKLSGKYKCVSVMAINSKKDTKNERY